MKKLIISLAAIAVLVGVMAVPVMAAEEETSTTASVSVNEVVSISLVDAGGTGNEGIRFNGGTPPIEGQGDKDQTDGTPAIKVKVEPETNVLVDIYIKGTATGSLALTNWKYSETFAGTKTSIPGAYGTAVYTDEVVGEYDFYHWVDVPEGTPSGSHGCTVYYKAQS
jgi:hypothetical protein